MANKQSVYSTQWILETRCGCRRMINQKPGDHPPGKPEWRVPLHRREHDDFHQINDALRVEERVFRFRETKYRLLDAIGSADIKLHIFLED